MARFIKQALLGDDGQSSQLRQKMLVSNATCITIATPVILIPIHSEANSSGHMLIF